MTSATRTAYTERILSGEPPKVLLAHPGTQYSFHLARELHVLGLLHRFWTGFAVAEIGHWGKMFSLLPASLRNLAIARVVAGLPGSKLRTLPLLEWRARRALRSHDAESVYFERNQRFQETIPDAELAAADIVVGFDTSSWVLARRAKAMGKRFILDQSIGHPIVKERIYAELRKRFPSWKTSMPKKAAALIAVEREEHELADLIVVPSGFVRETLVEEGVDQAKIYVNPFGTDLELFRPRNPSDRNGLQPLVVFLFVGALSARKGLPVLLDAWRQIGAVTAELWLVGPGTIPGEEQQTLPDTVKVFGKKTRQEVAALMRQAAVFVFPSFFEGLAQVQVEALASGLPVIATHEAGAADIVVDGQNGFLVDAGDAAGLANHIRQLAIDAPLRLKMQRTAAASREQLGWTLYGQRWSKVLR